MTPDLQSLADDLQARADACMANGERQYACGLSEAIQSIRRLVPAPVPAPKPVPAPEPVPEPVELPEGV